MLTLDTIYESKKLQKKPTDLVKSLKQHKLCLRKLHLYKGTRQRQVLYWPIKLQSKTSHLQKPNIKDCMVDTVSVVCPEVKSKVEAISLSRRTIVRRIDAITVNIQEQLLTASGNFQWFSIALDASIDIQDTAPLHIYLGGIDKNFEITEELLSMESLKDTVTGKDGVQQCH